MIKKEISDARNNCYFNIYQLKELFMPKVSMVGEAMLYFYQLKTSKIVLLIVIAT
jgi:hypothetical protein